VSELDAEFEKLREEARRRLDADKELEAKIDSFARLPEADPQIERPAPVEKPREREPDKAFEAAAVAARAAGKRVNKLSTTKLAIAAGVLILTLAVLDKIVAPILGLVILAVIVLLGIRFLRWFTGKPAAAPGDEEEDDDGD
jgi:hypothetical protein